ncbi:hypothetical protein H6P81_015424 [Aristolochia fimbriata]|uniref:Alkyl transferase n=1 Tax=Aristolochia fimbriata TaxID=158543 RepID=A0AAV7E7D7_ARIFI|nr:hypothetical protein H6P81_015424 [Aristolochia fimbriata]
MAFLESDRSFWDSFGIYFLRPAIAVVFVFSFIFLGWFLAWKLVLVHVPIVQEICGLRKKPKRPKSETGLYSRYYKFTQNSISGGSSISAGEDLKKKHPRRAILRQRWERQFLSPASALELSVKIQIKKVCKMEIETLSKFFAYAYEIFRRYVFQVLSFGPIPQHIAFIMDGNRRFARYWNLNPGKGHQVGFLALMSVLQYCYELGVKYVTVYAFSVDNFKRNPDEVQLIMDLMLEKIEALLKQNTILTRYGIKINFFGNLDLLSSPVREAVEKIVAATCGNSEAVLCICVAYSTTDEIIHAVQESCKEKLGEIQGKSSVNLDSVIELGDLEKHMYTAGCPDPAILVRTSGATRLSNFLLWQSSFCVLLAPDVLWPEISLRHLVWAILEYQRLCSYFNRKKQDRVQEKALQC